MRWKKTGSSSSMSTHFSLCERLHLARRRRKETRLPKPSNGRRAAGGKVGYDRTGYQFDQSQTLYAFSYHTQFIPDMSYIDAATWPRLSDADQEKAYKPCVPIVVVELMLGTDSIKDLQAQVTRFIDAGCREGVIVDTKRDRVWIYNQHQRPYFAPLAPIEFEWWPGFALDCIAIRDARLRDA